MAQESVLTIRIDLDSKNVESGFQRIQKQADSASKGIEAGLGKSGEQIKGLTIVTNQASSSFDALAAGAKNLIAIAGSLAGSFLAVKSALSLIKIDEQNTIALRSFESAASASGLAVTQLSERIKSSLGGFADFEDVLLQSSKVLNELGKEAAQRLPDLLDIARRASIKFGVDVKDAFESLTNAVVTTQTRQIRQLGLFVDANAALKEYASSIGVTVEQLTEFEKRQAVLNAILADGRKNLSDIDLSQQTVTSSLQRLSVALNNVVESFAAFFNRVGGDFFKNIINQTTTLANTIADALAPKSRADELLGQISSLNKQIFELQQQAEKGEGLINRLLIGIGVKDPVEQQIKILQNAKEQLKRELEKINLEARNAQVASVTQSASAVTEAERQANEIRLKNLSDFNLKLQEARNQASIAELNAQLVLADEEQKLRIQKELLEIEHQKRLDAILLEWSNKRGITQAQINLLIEAENQRHAAAVLQLENSLQAKRLEEQRRANNIYLQMAQAVNQAFANIVSQTFQRIGASLVLGGKAWANFGATILNIIGDLLINIGVAGIGIGKLIEAVRASLTVFSGIGAIAAGLAAIALGGLLKAVASSMMGSGFSAGPTPTFTGGVTDTGGRPIEQPVTQELEERETQRQTQAQVNVTIQGDVLDSDETGLRIVNLINTAFDKQGVVIRRGAQSYA